MGEDTNCCQSLGREGQDCVAHGMTSEFGGFYVWKQKSNGEMTAQDKIIAQSWAWIGEDASIVFDSFERAKSTHAKLARPFLEQFANKIIGQYSFTATGSEKPETITGIRLGLMGNTPPLHIPQTATPSMPRDYNGCYPTNGGVGRDSERQYIINPVNHAENRVAELGFVGSDETAEELAFEYIESTLDKIKRDHGIVIKTGIELECYAIGQNGKPSSKIIKAEEVEKDLRQHGFDVRFEDENTIDYYGQYEIVTGVSDALTISERVTKIRDFI